MSLRSDQTRARLGLGTAQFAEPRGRGGEAEIRAVLDTAAPAGVTLVDTAAAYGDVK